MARMRTINGAARHIKQIDPDSAISEWWLRTMIKSGKLKHCKAGNKYLIDIDYLLEEFLKNPPEEAAAPFEYGKLRQVKA